MAIKVGLGLSSNREIFQAVRSAVIQAKSALASERIDLAIVFSTIEFADSSVIKQLSNLLGDAPLIGASSLAIISNQGIFNHGLGIMLLKLPEGAYLNTALVNEISSKTIVSAGEELGEKLLFGFKGMRRDISLVFSDGLIKNESDFLSGLQEKLGLSFPLAGAAASDNLEFKKTYVYNRQEALSDAACAVLLGGKLNFGLGVKHGWKPLGKIRYVTSSSGNIVYEIDGVPAATIYKEYFGSDFAKLRDEFKQVSILYPLGIYLSGEEEYLLRNIIRIEDNGALVFQGNVPMNSPVRLMIGSKESCLLAAEQAATGVKRALSGKPCDFVLVFDSISRYILLGRKASRELEIIKQSFGENTPLLGLYTFGEQAPLKALNYQGKTYFHNQTITVLGLGG